MTRQHATPLLLNASGAVPLTPLSLGAGPDQINEAAIQQLLHDHPGCLPIAEIDPMFAHPVPICMELNTSAGPIDNLMITPTGLPVLVECKLWRNPEGRREVVGQILDYAKELSRWSASDLQREVARRVGGAGNPILRLLAAAGHDVDEIAFNDALTLSLRRGRFLLLIVGDGIREGVEAIAEYLQVHAGLHFSFGLVEVPIYTLGSGEKLLVPRVLARTTLITREVVAVPENFAVRAIDGGGGDPEEIDDRVGARRAAFMREVVAPPLALDPDQSVPKVSPKGWLALYLPAPASSCWISVLLKDDGRRVGIRLTSNVGTVGEAAIAHVIADWPEIAAQLKGDPALREGGPGRYIVEEFMPTNIANPMQRAQAVDWLRSRLRDFVAVFRPRIRDAVDSLKD